MKNALKLLSFVLLIGGAYLVVVAYAHKGPSGDAVLDFELPLSDFVIGYIKGMDYGVKQNLLFFKKGLLLPLGVIGAICVFMGILAIGVSRKISLEESSPEEEEEETTDKIKSGYNFGLQDADADIKTTGPAAAVDTGPKSLADDAQRIISLSQSSLDKKESVYVISELRPDLVPHLPTLEEDAIIKFSQKILQYHTIRLKRREKGISAAQFKLQDTRMNETERETICRRFMPSENTHVPEESVRLIGRVFSLMRQSELQQTLLSEVTDWADVSLRNAVDVLSDTPIKKPDSSSATLAS